ncbi:hypothetical protein DBV05_g3452 [Lasiodiplodia theobromae]|uniref:Uncharacterized protein n=1 Tax=Lasiodiplodia theobromae TaxID=45133 RepID=A0A5N5DJC9_9PEZI|nr:hypothetical protein DBV05_g3452 [Lasiodiplodia theobromae]
MPSSPDNAAALSNPQPGIGYLYQQHQRNRSRGVDTVQTRGRNISRYEFGRRDRHGERVTRIFPREIAKSPQSATRYQASPNTATSPLITAFGTTTSTAAHYTSEWTKSLPFFAGQAPPNGRSISGSPGQNFGVSNSPPTIGGRPMSHPNHYPSFGGRLGVSPRQSPPRDRRASMFSQYSQHPPLPHQPQSHFYGLPDVDFGLDGPQGELIPGANGYFCGFDTLDSAGDKPSSRLGQNALLVGYEGGLDVLDVRASHMNVLGRIEGLRGAVIGAKIVQWSGGADPCADDRPLVALVIHGPLLDGVKDTRHSSGSSSGACTDENEGSSSPPTRPASALGDTNLADVTHYQTTVEIWSLKKGTHVATLYKAPPVPLTTPLDSPVFQAPPPVGDLRIDAKGKFVVVASGCSGEVFVFSPKHEEAHPESFRCIGKVWTTVQVREHTPTPSSASSTELNSLESENVVSFGNPLFSLSERWLAVVPPGSSSLYSLNGATLLSPSQPKPPGMSTHAPPPPPSANCQVDAPEDSFFKNASREVAQQAMKGMQWAASTGMQAWKNYWSNKPASEQHPNGTMPIDNQGQAYFPPTHGHNQTSPQSSNEPSLVSIFDMQKMAEADSPKNRSTLQPLTTFTAPLGCSFLSFSPSGLMLMTFSKKGDNQFVWDLNCMHHTSSRGTRGNRSSQSHVRQVAKFTRMTIANIVDVAWSAPSARRLAILTDKGTVHMYPMPASAFQWPPPRRVRKSNEQPKKEVVEEQPAKGSGIIGSAAQNITGKAKPFFSSVRNRGGSVGSGFSLSNLSMTPAAGAKGGKAVAAGIGKSIGGAASNLKHASDNKLQLPLLINGVNPSSVAWLINPKYRDPRVALVSGGVLTIHKVNFKEVRSKNGRPQTRITKQKLVEYSLNPIRDSPIAPATLAYLTSKLGEDAAPLPGIEKSGESYWTPKAPAIGGAKAKGMMAHPLATAEIETNTPYQPFHTDRRIDLFVNEIPAQAHVEDEAEQEVSVIGAMHHVDDDGIWAFGSDIPSAKVTLPSSHAYDDDPLSDDLGLDINGNGPGPGGAAGMVSDFALREGDEEVEQVVVTTRRRRLKRKDIDEVTEPDEGFFEDDCEVWDFAGDRV